MPSRGANNQPHQQTGVGYEGAGSDDKWSYAKDGHAGAEPGADYKWTTRNRWTIWDTVIKNSERAVAPALILMGAVALAAAGKWAWGSPADPIDAAKVNATAASIVKEGYHKLSVQDRFSLQYLQQDRVDKSFPITIGGSGLRGSLTEKTGTPVAGQDPGCLKGTPYDPTPLTGHDTTVRQPAIPRLTPGSLTLTPAGGKDPISFDIIRGVVTPDPSALPALDYYSCPNGLPVRVLDSSGLYTPNKSTIPFADLQE